MPAQVAFRISVLFGLIAWGTVPVLYIWPVLSGLTVSDAVRPLLILHAFGISHFRFLRPPRTGAITAFASAHVPDPKPPSLCQALDRTPARRAAP